MKSFRPVLKSSVAFTFLASLLLPVYADDHVPGELLIKFKKAPVSTLNSLSLDDNKTSRLSPFQAIINHHVDLLTVQQRHVFSHVKVEHWQFSSSKELNHVLQTLKRDPNVLMVEPNYRRFPRSSHSATENAKTLSHQQLTQMNLDGVKADPSNRLVRVAIFDDAFELSHPDLIGRYEAPRNIVNSDSDVAPQTCEATGFRESHGTQVMGILAANDANNTGVTGATDSGVKVIPIRISCNYSVADELKAVDWAIENNADIVNISYGGPQFSFSEDDAIRLLNENGILLVAAAGNEEISNDRIKDYPSGLDYPNIIAVAAADAQKNLTNWSQYGATSVDLAAPGNEIGTTGLSGSYVSNKGTSFSSPLIAGVAATLLGRHSDKSVYDVKAALLASVIPYTSYQQASLASGGYVDALAAHELLGEFQRPPVPLVKSIEIDDSAGNNNGEIDPNEDIVLVLTLENIWGDADSMSLTLNSSIQGFSPIQQQLQAGLNGIGESFNGSSTQTSYGTAEVRFPIDFGVQTQTPGLLFTLDIRGKYASFSNDYQYERAFVIDTGSVDIDGIVQTNLRKHDQDDVHYYHVNVPERKGTVTISLEMLDTTVSANNLNLLVNRFNSPQFIFNKYEKVSSIGGTIIESVNRGTLVSAKGGSQSETITLQDVGEGVTLRIAVAASDESDATNIGYRMRISSTNKKLARGSISGCTVSINRAFDPTLILLALFAAVSLFRQRNQTKKMEKLI